jgi:uncharacterized alkaline shock family protein YloU
MRLSVAMSWQALGAAPCAAASLARHWRSETRFTVTTVDPTATAHPISQLTRLARWGATGARRADDARAGATSGGVEGKIEVSARAIATIAARAASDCYGVVGLAPRHSGLRPVERLAPARAARGVEARFVDDHIIIEVWVILESGLRVIEVAHNIMVGVKYAVEEALGLRVARVNVNIQALRVSPL